ncbi:hypothetical protein [Rhizobium leguminosarum]|uniref:hypothetical protein n=1 Tax=Rhizobium leguminosarum TaxID=384 RepID=UPI001C94BF21|nr:hypothetical protein [Rhizobium leguminosarum]
MMKTRVGFLIQSMIGGLVLLVPWMATAAASPVSVQGLLENVCIASRLNEKSFASMVKTAGSVLHLSSRPIPPEMLPQLNPDATSGWSLSAGKQAFFLVFAKRTVDTTVSNSCTVTSPIADYDAIKTFIETKYAVRKIGDQQQGSSTLTGYKVSLVGFDKPSYYLSIQHVEPSEGVETGMVMVSFFDSNE